MPESSLILSRDDLYAEWGHRLGYGRTVEAWNTDQLEDVRAVARTALRKVYFCGHSWSYLRPLGTVTTVSGVADYDLSDDFGGMTDPWLTFAEGIGYGRIPVVMENVIRDRRAATTSTGIPTRAAIRPKRNTGTAGTRWELLLWPEPSGAWDLSFRYELMPGALTDERPYPVGSAHLSELFRLSGHAVIEKEYDHEEGPMVRDFENELARAIQRDASLHSPKTLGCMGPAQGLSHEDYYRSNTALVTYGGFG